jgi:plastocyanin
MAVMAMRALYGVIGLIVLALGSYAYRTSTSAAEEADMRGESRVFVVLGENGFSPQHLRIDAGTTVVFSTTRENQFWPASNPHPSHTILPGFDAEHPLAPTEIWEHTFAAPGIWGYHDHIRSYYTGSIYVD